MLKTKTASTSIIVIGVTGSIGMGKSTAGKMLEHLGVPVHDADQCVHELLQPSSRAWAFFTEAFPHASAPHLYRKEHFWSRQISGINRKALGDLIFTDEIARRTLERILHPFVRQAQNDFIRQEQQMGRRLVALEIPLLFETGAEHYVDYTINISAPAFLQQARVLRRPKMNPQKLKAIIARQMPDGEKSARADFTVQSGLGHAHMMKALKKIVKDIE